MGQKVINIGHHSHVVSGSHLMAGDQASHLWGRERERGEEGGGGGGGGRGGVFRTHA